MVESRWLRRAGPADRGARGARGHRLDDARRAATGTWVRRAVRGADRGSAPGAPGRGTGSTRSLSDGASGRAAPGRRPSRDAVDPVARPGRRVLRGRPVRRARSWSAPTTDALDALARRSWRGHVPLAARGSDDVVRTATLSPDGATIVEARVDRRTRADLGVWRRPLDGRRPRPRPAADRSPTRGSADLAHRAACWSDGRPSLAVQSCGEVACRFRVLDRGPVSGPDSSPTRRSATRRLAATGSWCTARAAGCPVRSSRSTRTATGRDHCIDDARAGRDEPGRRWGEPVVVHEVGADGHDAACRSASTAVTRGRWMSTRDGRRLVAGAARSGGAG